MKNKSISIMVSASLGTLLGIAIVFVPFFFDAIHYRNPAVAVIGYIYFFIIIALLLSSIIRFAGTLLSRHIRCLVVKHPVIHAIWFAIGFGIIIGVLIIMFFGPAKAKGYANNTTLEATRQIYK